MVGIQHDYHSLFGKQSRFVSTQKDMAAIVRDPAPDYICLLCFSVFKPLIYVFLRELACSADASR